MRELKEAILKYRKQNCAVVGRFKRTFYLIHSPPHLLCPSPQINEGEKLQCSDSFCGSAALSDWKCQQGKWYISYDERRVQKYSTTAMKCSCLHSRTSRLLNRTQQHHPRDLRPTPLQSNFVSPILGIRDEHERSYATNHCIPNASATYSGLPWGKSLSLFLSLFKMGAKLVTYHKGVFS